MNDITVDPDTSTITIAGRRWPAVALVCPAHEDERREPTEDWERVLGDIVPGIVDGGWDIFIPLENGVLVDLRIDHAPQRRIDVHLSVLACFEYVWSKEPNIWLPLNLGLRGSDLFLGQYVTGWIGCDPEWINELIDRVGSKTVPTLPDTPRARMINLNDTLLAHKSMIESRK